MSSYKRKYLPVYCYQLNGFYAVQNRQALSLVKPTLVLLFTLALTVYMMTDLRTKRLHAPVDAEGKPLSDVSLSDPLYSNERVSKWLKKASKSIFDFSSGKVSERFSELQLYYFTKGGYESWHTELDNIGLISWLEGGTNLSILEPGEIILVRDGVSDLNGRYKWRFKTTGTLVTVKNGKDNTDRFELTIDVLRVSRLGTEFAARINRIHAVRLK